jgi:HK97 family phage prohead protease
MTVLDPAAAFSDVADNGDGTVSSSQDEPSCIVDGCDQSVMPGHSTCGYHADPKNVQGPDVIDGSVAPQSVVGVGFQDGTGRSAKKPRHRTQRSRLQQYLHDGELRAEVVPNKDSVIVSGTAIVYDVRTTINDVFGSFGESIRPGAAAHLLGGDVRLLSNHEGLPLARTTSGTLLLREADNGVNFAAELDVAGSPLAADVVSGVRRGDLSGCSFAFTVGDGDDVWNSKMTERVIKRFATIPEISIVTFPAYPTTSVSARSAQLRARQQRLRLRREQIRRHVDAQELHSMLTRGIPLTRKPNPASQRVTDKVDSERRTLNEAGELRRAAMKQRGVRSYRSLRAALNSGKDREEIR